MGQVPALKQVLYSCTRTVILRNAFDIFDRAGAATESSLQSAGLDPSLSECVDLELTLSAFRAAFFVDFGAANRFWSLYAQQKLHREEQDVVRLLILAAL